MKGFFLILLLYEIEHFFLLLDDNKEKDFNDITMGKEGRKLFIKYLFGVETIDHINYEQAKKIINIENWDNHEFIKLIFKDQKENNIINPKQNYFPDSISFYSIMNKRKKTRDEILIKK